MFFVFSRQCRETFVKLGCGSIWRLLLAYCKSLCQIVCVCFVSLDTTHFGLAFVPHEANDDIQSHR